LLFAEAFGAKNRCVFLFRGMRMKKPVHFRRFAGRMDIKRQVYKIDEMQWTPYKAKGILTTALSFDVSILMLLSSLKSDCIKHVEAMETSRLMSMVGLSCSCFGQSPPFSS
jgi:hypothetical protein